MCIICNKLSDDQCCNKNIWVSQGGDVGQVRLKIFIQHTTLATLPSIYQNLLKLVLI